MVRDFTKSNKDYFAKNRVGIIGVSVFLIIGIIICALFGLNGNFEISGYNEFSIKPGANTDNYSTICNTAEDIVNAYGGEFEAYQISAEGENTEIVIKYSNTLTSENQAKLNAELQEALSIDANQITEHVVVKPIVEDLDFVYTLTAILILLVVASLFAYFRYNGASAITIILACLISSLTFISINSILRLTVGMSFFAMMVILNAIVIYFAINIFESMRKENWLGNNESATALKSAIKETKTRISIFSVAIMLLGVLFVVTAPVAMKYVSLNIMFMSVVVLAAAWYVIPFIWSTLITSSRKKEYKVKATKEETNN